MERAYYILVFQIDFAEIKCGMRRQYIADEIGNEYQNWANGDVVFITASTGAGKSYFILNIYLEWIMKRRKRLLYLVNRRILREQLQSELNTEIARVIRAKHGLEINVQDYIKITTYKIPLTLNDNCSST